MSIIEMKDVVKKYGNGTTALRSVSINVEPGEFAYIVGPSGAGNLDPDNSWEIMNLLERINLQGTTVLMATHNSQIVNTLRHRVIAIENGRVVRDEAEGEYGYDD